MTNLVSVDGFDDVPQMEVNTPLLGGPGGPLNAPAQALLNRTAFLKSEIESFGLPGGDMKIIYLPDGSGASEMTLHSKLSQFPTFADKGTTGDGANDDTEKFKSAISSLGPRGRLVSTPIVPGANYKLTSTVTVRSKQGAVIDFGNQQLNFASAPVAGVGMSFELMSEAQIDNLFVSGSIEKTTIGALFGASLGESTIHARVGYVHAQNCEVGVQVGVEEYQFDDAIFSKIYATGCRVGARLTGKNTLAMSYDQIAAFFNSEMGVHIEEGGGHIKSLASAGSGTNIFFGRTDGTLHKNLVRWDIASGYSEMGMAWEVLIDSAACTDDQPFDEEIVINGFRATAFSVTVLPDFIRWRLNGKLTLRDCTLTHGQQEPYIFLDHNDSYFAPIVEVDGGIIDCGPKSAPQVPMSYVLTSPKQTVEINARFNNAISFWNNGGNPGQGVIRRGVYMAKISEFEKVLLSIPNIVGAWSLRDASSGTCLNSVLGGANLSVSAALSRRDLWFDDGLVGFHRAALTSSKIISGASDEFSAAAEWTFFCILRPTAAGSSEENATNIGGESGMRIALYDGALLCLVGGSNAFVQPTHPYDAHAVIGRYVSGQTIQVDAINLRTGELLTASTSVAVPNFESLTWDNKLSMRNDHTVRGFTAAIRRSITANEVRSTLQMSTLLTSSWRK